jgi:hypothetical protein
MRCGDRSGSVGIWMLGGGPFPSSVGKASGVCCLCSCPNYSMVLPRCQLGFIQVQSCPNTGVSPM